MSRIERQSSFSNLIPRRLAGTSAPDAKLKKAVASTADTLAIQSSSAPWDARNFGAFLQDQNQDGISNACGTTSLAMLLSFWKRKPEAYTKQEVDQQIRRFDILTSPQNIVDYASSQGLRAVVRNDATLAEMKQLLDQGIPVQVLYDPDGNGADRTLHYVVATDYSRDDRGNITAIKIADPWGGVEDSVPVEDFLRRWDNPEILGKSTGLNNLMIPMLPKENVPIRGKDGVTRLSRDIALPDGTKLGWRALVTDKLLDAANLFDKTSDTLAIGAKQLWGRLFS